METGKSLFSPTKVYESLKLLRRDQGVVEIRLLNAKQIGQNRTRAITGYFDFEHLKDAVRMLQSKVAEFDIMMATLNTINPALLARTGNGFAWDAEACSTSDGDVLRLQWLVVDLDPIRPSGISSNDAEHEAAHALATSVQVHLHGLGFPDPIVNDSGNGAHLIYPIDLPASDASLVKDCLEALAGLHDSSLVKVDTTLGNASRAVEDPGGLCPEGNINHREAPPAQQDPARSGHPDAGEPGAAGVPGEHETGQGQSEAQAWGGCSGSTIPRSACRRARSRRQQ